MGKGRLRAAFFVLMTRPMLPGSAGFGVFRLTARAVIESDVLKLLWSRRMHSRMKQNALWLLPVFLVGCQAGDGRRSVVADAADPEARQTGVEVAPASAIPSTWSFSEVGGDCPAAFEFIAQDGGMIASDYCGVFDELYVGISGRVVELKRVDPDPAPSLGEGLQRSFQSEAGDTAVLRIGRLMRKEFDPQSTDEGCTRPHFDAVLRVRPVGANERVVHGRLSGGCP